MSPRPRPRARARVRARVAAYAAARLLFVAAFLVPAAPARAADDAPRTGHAGPAAPAPDAHTGPDAPYVVKPGDTCVGVAKALFPGDAHALARLHYLNPELGPLPHTLVPGMPLRARADAPDARLTFVRPLVEARLSVSGAWAAAPHGKALWARNEVHTRAAARAELTFRDAAVLRMESEALVVIYGATPWTPRPPRSGTVTLVEGDLRLRLPALRDGAPALALTTPGARVETAGADAHVGVDPAKTSRVSVFDGRATVAAKGAKVAVAKGWGTRVPKGKAPEKPTPLLPAPAWLAPAAGAVRVALDEPAVPLALEWSAVPGAVKYRAELARDVELNDVVADETLAASVRRLDTAPLDPGRYWARVYAVDARGLRGMPSPARPVDVVHLALEHGLRDPASPGAPLLRGKGAVALATAGLESVDVYVDGALVAPPLVVTAPGRHELRLFPRGADPATAAGATLLVEVEPGPIPPSVAAALASKSSRSLPTRTAAPSTVPTPTAVAAAAFSTSGTAPRAPAESAARTTSTTPLVAASLSSDGAPRPAAAAAAAASLAGASSPFSPTAPPAPSVPRRSVRVREIGLFFSGLGVTGLVAAAITGTRARVLRDELAALPLDSPARTDLERRRHTMAAATTLLGAGGALLTASGLTILVVGLAGRW